MVKHRGVNIAIICTAMTYNERDTSGFTAMVETGKGRQVWESLPDLYSDEPISEAKEYIDAVLDREDIRDSELNKAKAAK
jgi:hypothetical protein